MSAIQWGVMLHYNSMRNFTTSLRAEMVFDSREAATEYIKNHESWHPNECYYQGPYQTEVREQAPSKVELLMHTPGKRKELALRLAHYEKGCHAAALAAERAGRGEG